MLVGVLRVVADRVVVAREEDLLPVAAAVAGQPSVDDAGVDDVGIGRADFEDEVVLGLVLIGVERPRHRPPVLAVVVAAIDRGRQAGPVVHERIDPFRFALGEERELDPGEAPRGIGNVELPLPRGGELAPVEASAIHALAVDGHVDHEVPRNAAASADRLVVAGIARHQDVGGVDG